MPSSQDFPECDLLIVIGTSLAVGTSLPRRFVANEHQQVHPFASLIDEVPEDCPRLLINRELVGESRGKWDDGFKFEEGSRDWFERGYADEVIWELCREVGWEVSGDEACSR